MATESIHVEYGIVKVIVGHHSGLYIPAPGRFTLDFINYPSGHYLISSLSLIIMYRVFLVEIHRTK